MKQRTTEDEQTTSHRSTLAAMRRRQLRNSEQEAEFDGGDPDFSRSKRAPHLGQAYLVVGRTWIARSVVAASIVFPVLVLGALLLGLPPASAAVVAAALTPLGILARAVARHFF